MFLADRGLNFKQNLVILRPLKSVHPDIKRHSLWCNWAPKNLPFHSVGDESHGSFSGLTLEFAYISISTLFSKFNFGSFTRILRSSASLKVNSYFWHLDSWNLNGKVSLCRKCASRSRLHSLLCCFWAATILGFFIPFGWACCVACWSHFRDLEHVGILLKLYRHNDLPVTEVWVIAF